MTKKRKQNTVKIDESLLERINILITAKSMRIKYANKKQFINMAVLKLLNEEEKNEKRYKE